MKRLHALAAAIFLIVSSSAWAAPATVILEVPGMTCPTCPITIKKALLKEQGVSGVAVRYEEKELVVSFDNAKTTPAKIMQSTASVGFPSQVAK
jgi:mercuric ion binding protein